MIFCEDVTSEGTREKRDKHTRERNNHTVHHVTFNRDVFVGENRNVVFESWLLWEEIWRSLAQFRFILERGDHDIEEWQQCGDQAKDENRVCTGFTENPKWGFVFLLCVHVSTPIPFSECEIEQS